MEDIVTAIEKLSEKTWIDYALVIVPILISLFAVFVSIATAKKQNRIALFEKKYKALCLLKNIFDFEKTIEKQANACVIVQCFDMSLNCDLAQHSKDDALIKASNILSKIDNDISVIYYINNAKYRTMINDILRSLANVLADAIVGKVNYEEKQKLHKSCIKFYSLGFVKLEKRMKI